MVVTISGVPQQVFVILVCLAYTPSHTEAETPCAGENKSPIDLNTRTDASPETIENIRSDLQSVKGQLRQVREAYVSTTITQEKKPEFVWQGKWTWTWSEKIPVPNCDNNFLWFGQTHRAPNVSQRKKQCKLALLCWKTPNGDMFSTRDV